MCFDSSLAIHQMSTKPRPQWGMRILLDLPQECVSTWPGDQWNNHHLRMHCEDGINAVRDDGAYIKCTLKYGLPHYSVETRYDRKGRLGQREARLATVLLPKDTYKTAERLGAVVMVWSPRDRTGFESFLQDLPRSLDKICGLEHRLSDAALTELQVFLMGSTIHCSFLSWISIAS